MATTLYMVLCDLFKQTALHRIPVCHCLSPLSGYNAALVNAVRSDDLFYLPCIDAT